MIYEREICNSIMKLSSETEVVIIGIDGLGGAGKSTISERICCEIKNNNIHTILLHIDDFINEREVRYNTEYLEWQCYYDLQWRYKYFADKDNDCYFTKNYDIKEKTVVIVEGIFLQRKELYGIFDYMVYIDVPEDERMARLLKRDTYIGNEQQIIDKYENRYFPAERKYFNEYNPEQSADFVIGE